MIERIENTLQIAILLVCVAVALFRAFRQKSKVWTLLALFFGSWVIGDLYWLACLVFFDTTPVISVVSDLSWYASYLFLYLLLRQISPPHCHSEPVTDVTGVGIRNPLAERTDCHDRSADRSRNDGIRELVPWIGPVFALAMAAFYLQWGEVLGNLIYAGLMGLLLFAALRRLTDREQAKHARLLCVVILMFCLMEYGLWTASCFWKTDALANPYYWFDLLLTACFPFFLPATRKAVAV